MPIKTLTFFLVVVLIVLVVLVVLVVLIVALVVVIPVVVLVVALVILVVVLIIPTIHCLDSFAVFLCVYYLLSRGIIFACILEMICLGQDRTKRTRRPCASFGANPRLNCSKYRCYFCAFILALHQNLLRCRRNALCAVLPEESDSQYS